MAAREYPETTEHRVSKARGGVAFGPIATGVVVAFGAMFLLSAVVGGALAGLGYWEGVEAGQVTEIGIGAGIALVVAQFLSYLWGGYTAGRMGRGAGLANGLLVPLAALAIALIVVGIAAMWGARATVNLPFTTTQLPLQDQTLVSWGVGIGVASLIAMFLGGALGGALGARWHSKLERRTYEEERPVTEERAGAQPAAAAATPPPAPRTTGEGVHYEAEGTRTRRTDEGDGRREEIDLSEERSER